MQCSVCLNEGLEFSFFIGLNVIDGWLNRLLEFTVIFREKSAVWQWLDLVQGVEASLSVSGGKAKCCVCLWDGPISINSAITKAAVQGYTHKAAWICFAVMSACLSLSLSNLVATYTSERYLPIAQCHVSHQGLCVMILNLLGYEPLISLGAVCLSRNNADGQTYCHQEQLHFFK